MGNTLDSPPTSFSRNDTNKMQQDAWTNTYTGAPRGAKGVDSVEWGNKGSRLSFGVKIIQDTTTNQLYVTTPAGHKVWLTTNGVPLPNASQLVKFGANFGVGPAVMISGDPLKPTYSMFSASDQSPGKGYKEININSMADVKYAMSLNSDAYDTNAITNSYLNNKNSGQFGEASISGPFAPRPRNIWSGVADFNRASNDIFEKIAIPVAADLIGKVIPGFGFISSALGIQDDLQNALDKAYNTRKVLNAPTQFQNYMSNRIKDPRLQPLYAETAAENARLLKKTGEKANSNVQNMSAAGNIGMLLKARALAGHNSSMTVLDTEKELNNVIGLLKTKLGNKVDWSYFDQMKYGLSATQDTDAQMNILTHFTNKLNTVVTPLLQEQQPVAPSTPATPAPVPPKGGGFGLLPWHPYVINGDYYHHPQKVSIRG